jgi:hypothetical protein
MSRAKKVYSADDAEGTNTYLLSILQPTAGMPMHIPDLNSNQVISKTVNYNTNISSNFMPTVGPYSTNSDMLFHFTPQSKFSVLSVYVNVGTVSLPQWLFAQTVSPDQILSNNFSLIRYVAGAMDITSSTIGAGAFAVQGQIWGVAYQDPASFYTSSAQTLLASRKDDRSYLENHILADGITTIGGPSVDLDFRPPDTNAITNSGPSVDIWFQNSRAGGGWDCPNDSVGSTNISVNTNAGFYPNGSVSAANPFTTPASVPNSVLWAACSPGWTGARQNSSTNPATALYTNPAPVLPNILRGDIEINFFVEVSATNFVGIGTYAVGLQVTTADNNQTYFFSQLTFGGDYSSQVAVTGSGRASRSIQISAVVPIVSLCLFYNSLSAPSIALTSANTLLGVHVQNSDVLRAGELSNGSFVAITGLPTGAAPAQVVSINGLVGYEAVPNSNLAQNVQTFNPKIDLTDDISAVKVVLANKTHYNVRSVYKHSDYEVMCRNRHFEQVAERSTVRAVAFGLDDVFGGLKSLARAALPLATNSLSSALRPLGLSPLADIGGGMLQQALSSDKQPNGKSMPRLLCAGEDDEKGSDSEGGDHWSEISDSEFSNELRTVMIKDNTKQEDRGLMGSSGTSPAPTPSIKPESRMYLKYIIGPGACRACIAARGLRAVALNRGMIKQLDDPNINIKQFENPTPEMRYLYFLTAKHDCTIGCNQKYLCSDGDEKQMLSELSEHTANESKDLIDQGSQRMGDHEVRVKMPTAHLQTNKEYIEDVENYTQFFTSEYQEKADSSRYNYLTKLNKIFRAPVNTAKFPVIDANNTDKGYLLNLYLTFKPFRYIPQTNTLTSYVAADLPGGRKLYFQEPTFSLAETVQFVEAYRILFASSSPADDMYLTVNTDVELGGNSCVMAFVALLTGVPLPLPSLVVSWLAQNSTLSLTSTRN